MHGQIQNAVEHLDASRLRTVGRRRAVEQWQFEGHLENPYKKGTPEHDGFAVVVDDIERQELSDSQMKGYC